MNEPPKLLDASDIAINRKQEQDARSQLAKVKRQIKNSAP